MAKELHETLVLRVKQAIAAGEYPSLSAVARAFDLPQSLVNRIANGERWAHVELVEEPREMGFRARLGGDRPRVQRGGRHLTDEQARYARRCLLHKGKTMRELALELGVHIDVIRRIKDGRSYRDVEAYGGVKVIGRIGNARQKLTPEQQAEILERVGAGETQRSVADSLGIPLSTLSHFYVSHRRRTGEGRVRSCPRLTADQRQQIYERATAGRESQRAIARDFGIRQQTVSRIVALLNARSAA